MQAGMGVFREPYGNVCKTNLNDFVFALEFNFSIENRDQEYTMFINVYYVYEEH